MTVLDQAFDSDDHDDMDGGFDPMPKGDYLCKVVETEINETSAGTGKYIKVKFEVIQGDFKGRFVWTNINIINPNPVAVEIAKKELATLCRAIGKSGTIKDTNELHGIPLTVKVKIKPAKDGYDAGNETTGYLPANNTTPTQVQEANTSVQDDDHPGWD